MSCSCPALITIDCDGDIVAVVDVPEICVTIDVPELEVIVDEPDVEVIH